MLSQIPKCFFLATNKIIQQLIQEKTRIYKKILIKDRINEQLCGGGVGDGLQVMKSTVWHQCLRTQTSKVHIVEKPMNGAYKMHVSLPSFKAEIMNWKCPGGKRLHSNDQSD